MAFRSPASQALKMIKVLNHATKASGEKAIKGIQTGDNYQKGLTRAAEWLKDTNNGQLHHMTPELGKAFLEDRASEVGQKELDQERQAIQCMFRFGNHQLEEKETLEVIKSDFQQVLASRSYTQEQINYISEHQNTRNALATLIAADAGLRAHELYTLQRIDERKPDDRPANSEKFSGHEGQAYTVQGKGGLVREIRIQDNLARQLEDRRLEIPKEIIDRNIRYQSHYDIGGGKNWSNSFSKASSCCLGFSNGAHGLRHSFAQNRMEYFQKVDLLHRELALETVSQELGHFRAAITEVYLR